MEYDLLIGQGSISDAEDTVLSYDRKARLLHMRVKVDNKDVVMKIATKDLSYLFTPSGLHELGYTQRVVGHPWLLKYDETNDVYVVVLEDMEVEGLEVRLDGTCTYYVWCALYV